MILIEMKFSMTHNVPGFMLGYLLPSTTEAKLIIKSSLFVLKIKDAGPAKTNAWLCF
jgi:hypothetical protein